MLDLVGQGWSQQLTAICHGSSWWCWGALAITLRCIEGTTAVARKDEALRGCTP